MGAPRKLIAILGEHLSLGQHRILSNALGIFNLNDGYQILLEVEIFATAIYMCHLSRKLPPPGVKEGSEPFLHSFVRTLLMAFGGGTLVPPLSGRPSAWLMLDSMAICLLLAWILIYKVPGVRHVYGHPLVLPLGFALCETFRVQTIWLLTGICAKAIGPTMYFDPPLVGPIICGTLAGCSGLLLPFDKGLSALLQDPLPYNVVSAFLIAVVCHVSTNLIPAWAPELAALDLPPFLRSIAAIACVACAPRLHQHLDELFRWIGIKGSKDKVA